MSRLNDWMNPSRLSAPEDANRAASVWAWINRKPDIVTLVRGETALAAQTVRIEFNTTTRGTELKSDTGASSKQYAMIFGIQGHATETDTNIQRGDQFSYLSPNGALNYEVLSVDKTQIGQVQAIAEELQ